MRRQERAYPSHRGEGPSQSWHNERNYNQPQQVTYRHDSRNADNGNGDSYAGPHAQHYSSYFDTPSSRHTRNGGHAGGYGVDHSQGYVGREEYGREAWRPNSESGYYEDGYYSRRGYGQAGQHEVEEHQRRGYHSYPSTRRGSPSRQPYAGPGGHDDTRNVRSQEDRFDTHRQQIRGTSIKGSSSHSKDHRRQPTQDHYIYDHSTEHQNGNRYSKSPSAYLNSENESIKPKYIPPRPRKAGSKALHQDPRSAYGDMLYPTPRPNHDTSLDRPSRQDTPPRNFPPPSFTKSVRKGEFVPTSLPPAEYLALSDPKHLANSLPDRKGKGRVGKKLLVLDLNGAMLYRTKGSERVSYPRPYLGNFLEYVFAPDTSSTSNRSSRMSTSSKNDHHGRSGQSYAEDDGRGYEVHVWSSAQPHNVRTMVETAFGPRWIQGVYEPEEEVEKSERISKGEGRLLGVWARDMMNLNSQDYGQNVQTFKDLRRIIDHVAHPPSTAQYPPMQFDEKSVILLDDSPLKAVNQPWNQVVLPEFDKTEYQQAKALYPFRNEQENPKDLDQALLAVIGILDALRHVENVPAWVRAGGLTNPSLDLEALIRYSGAREEVEVQLEHLPSHASFTHWFADEEILRGWIKKGREALQRRRIKVDPGIDQNGRRKRTGSSPRPKTQPQASA